MHILIRSLLLLLPVAAVAAGILLLRMRRAATVAPPSTRPVHSASLASASAYDSWVRIAKMSLVLLPLAIAAVLLATRWQAIPQRFPIHWDLNGAPNGWAHRNVFSIFGPLAVGAFLAITFMVVAELIDRYSPRFAGSPALMGTSRSALYAGAWLMSILFSHFSVLALAPHPSQFVPSSSSAASLQA